MALTKSKLKVRQADIADAANCSEVLCASIRELCTADHHGEEHTIARWLENKTPETLRSWIQSPEATIYVAEIDGVIVGVGGVSGSEVALNYVSPSYRSLGVSTAILNELEKVLLERGIHDAQLTSTATAHNFYLKAGWLDCGEPEESLGVVGFPMRKTL
ncbi:MAG: GNAT family N-acetyltransferase [Pseudomonadales bacterium]